MSEASSSGFKWKLTRDVVFDVWQLQFKAFMDTKGCLKWLTTLLDEAKETEKASEATAKSHIVLAMKAASLISLSATSGSSAKEYWPVRPALMALSAEVRTRKQRYVYASVSRW